MLNKDKISERRANLREAFHQRRFLLPNLVTLGNLFCGFLSIIYASSGRYEKAVLAIFVGALLDALDGRVARRFDASSKFGLEFDSLSDLVTFGVAPAFLMYQWCFKTGADEFGVIVCFIYVICAAARLARFNVVDSGSKDFTGMPSPAAAAMIVSVVNLFPSIALPTFSVALGSAYILIVAYLMVCHIPYSSGKKFKFKNQLSFVILVGALIAMLWYEPRLTVFLLALTYCLSGPVKLLPFFSKKQAPATPI